MAVVVASTEQPDTTLLTVSVHVDQAVMVELPEIVEFCL